MSKIKQYKPKIFWHIYFSTFANHSTVFVVCYQWFGYFSIGLDDFFEFVLNVKKLHQNKDCQLMQQMTKNLANNRVFNKWHKTVDGSKKKRKLTHSFFFFLVYRLIRRLLNSLRITFIHLNSIWFKFMSILRSHL